MTPEQIIEMTLIMTQDAAQRRAFVDGFNDQPLQRYAGTRMQRNYQLGQTVGQAVRVRSILKEQANGE